MARKPRQFFKASEWELEDAEEEHVEIVVNHSPKAFVIEDGKLTGMMFDKMEYDFDAQGRDHRRADRRRGVLPVRRRDPRDRPGERVPVDRARPRHRVRQVATCRSSTRSRSSRRGPACSSAATRRSARRTSSGPSSTATRPRSRSTTTARAAGHEAALPRGVNLSVAQDGHARVVVQATTTTRSSARLMPHVEPQGALQEAQHRGRARLHGRAGRDRGRSAASTATCRPCSRRSSASSATPASTSVPTDCLTITPNGDEAELVDAAQGAAPATRPAAVRVRRRCSRPGA